MPEEGNGQYNGLSRLDRIERAIEGLSASQQQFQVSQEQLLAAQKQLLTAQVILTDSVDRLTARVDLLAAKVDSHENRLQALIDSQLRMDDVLSSIRMMLERQQGK